MHFKNKKGRKDIQVKVLFFLPSKKKSWLRINKTSQHKSFHWLLMCMTVVSFALLVGQIQTHLLEIHIVSHKPGVKPSVNGREPWGQHTTLMTFFHYTLTERTDLQIQAQNIFWTTTFES